MDEDLRHALSLASDEDKRPLSIPEVAQEVRRLYRDHYQEHDGSTAFARDVLEELERMFGRDYVVKLATEIIRQDDAEFGPSDQLH
jgi:hypothetical protein